VDFAVKPGELINCHCTFRPVLPELQARHVSGEGKRA
jgi:hypothetical protein